MKKYGKLQSHEQTNNIHFKKKNATLFYTGCVLWYAQLHKQYFFYDFLQSVFNNFLLRQTLCFLNFYLINSNNFIQVRDQKKYVFKFFSVKLG